MVKWWLLLVALAAGILGTWLLVVVPAEHRAAADLAKYNADRALTQSQLADARSNLADALASLGTARTALAEADRATAAASRDAAKLRVIIATRDANDRKLAEQFAASLAGAKSSVDVYQLCDFLLHAIFDRYHSGPNKQGPGG